jgi:hypothetical protein
MIAREVLLRHEVVRTRGWLFFLVCCFALALYGPHASGADLDANERAMLRRIAQSAAAVYAEIENDELRRQVSALERKLSKPSKITTGSAKRRKRAPDS